VIKVGPTSTGNCGLVATKEPTLDITKETIPLSPPVVQQQDTNSCGPLSILNAYCMIRLHKQAFTYEYAGVNLEGQRLKDVEHLWGHGGEKSLNFATQSTTLIACWVR
jgi:hypothetical protein